MFFKAQCPFLFLFLGYNFCPVVYEAAFIANDKIQFQAFRQNLETFYLYIKKQFLNA